MTNLKELGNHLAEKKISDYRACPTLQTEIDNWYGRMPTKADRDECRNMFNHIVPHLNSKQIRPIIDWAKKIYKSKRDDYICQQVLESI